jgi:hypothetical protein
MLSASIGAARSFHPLRGELTMARHWLTAILLLATASANGCMCGGGSETVVQSAESCGKELQDLQKALETRAIDQTEYNRLRKAAMERCD